MAIPDPIQQGIKSGWQVVNGLKITKPSVFEADVVIIGTGAGGGIAAEILSNAGLTVLMVEEGLLRSSNDFNMDEHIAYAELYQEGGGRSTKDGAITIMQGKAVGGTTVVNWTSCFHTPDATLQFWQDQFSVTGITAETLAPWYQYIEKRLNIGSWDVPPNPNNGVLKTGCEKLGYQVASIPRNVKGCWNLGYCGTGCPTNAKQSMLVTAIPTALNNNATLLYATVAQRFNWQQNQVNELVCFPLQKANGVLNKQAPIKIKAKHYLLAAGAIGSPAILLRSNVPDPYRRIGQRTFLHPVTMSVAQMSEKIAGYSGAPQSIYSDHFQWPDGDSMGFKLEVPPLQPVLASVLMKKTGDELHQHMLKLPYTQVLLALLRDGFHPESQGGRVILRNDGTPVLDYPITPYIWRAVKHSLLTMAEIQFAAGATQVFPAHIDSSLSSSWPEVKEQINSLDLVSYKTLLGSAHVMGGCGMGEKPYNSVVNSQSRFHHLDNLSILDGSVFPSSIGANPQLSIYAFSALQSSRLANELKS
ncbi:GMC family oxidoreductase [Endozoicomonas sp. SM1973]|uniref:GMC family oxidoreductase n=1 Tax=Spartinivicinus marinus TaxID=2994442 RepID=A0A853I8B3_9GAMM|nr:GMC family oxidoreductase [Spartinivicinus marinus]MCX4027278.1 GMC family oxidoreductase [Spartinivicinus marinus]NYZ67962.1 GMC family oxidoreductase [Spartinivicinus marinus]